MAFDLKRWWRHEWTGARALRKALPAEALARLGDVVAACEARHGGEIRFVVEASLDLPLFGAGQSGRERALEIFSQLRVWDTEANNGVLIYLLLADHDLEIVADRGIDRVVGPEGWETVCRDMETALRAGRFEEGLRLGIEEVSAHLERHFPRQAGDRNELPDAPFVME
jgi:uncharacterized membrane protein